MGRRFGFKGRTREFVEFLGEDGHEYARQRLEQYAKTTRGKWQISEAGLTSIAKWITDYARGRVPGYQSAVGRAVEAVVLGRTRHRVVRGHHPPKGGWKEGLDNKTARASGQHRRDSARGTALKSDKDFNWSKARLADSQLLEIRPRRGRIRTPWKGPIFAANHPLPAGASAQEAPPSPTSLEGDPAAVAAPAEEAAAAVPTEAKEEEEADFGGEDPLSIFSGMECEHWEQPAPPSEHPSASEDDDTYAWLSSPARGSSHASTLPGNPSRPGGRHPRGRQRGGKRNKRNRKNGRCESRSTR